MPQVQCPSCGAIGDTRAADYPFCARCQDNLAKCGYCRWFSATAAVCTHPVVSGVFEVSEAATPPCVYHVPSDRVLVKRRLTDWLAWTVGAMLVIGLALGVARLREPAVVAPPVATLNLRVEASYADAVVGKPEHVAVSIRNTSTTLRVKDVRVEVEKTSLADLELVSVSPPPLAREELGKWEVLHYPDMQPSEQRRVSLEVVPKRAGALHLRVRVVTEGNVYHGMADLPVIAEPAKER